MKTPRLLAPVMGLVLMAGLQTGCGAAAPATPPPQTAMPQAIPVTASPARQATSDLPAKFSGEQAYRHVLSQMALGPRITGTPQNRALGDAILSNLTANGWQTRTQEFTYRDTPVRNVWGVKGVGATVRIIGAHYDTRRRADQDAISKTAPVPGANDGASGVAVLMELARVARVREGEQLWLVFFDAEDNGDLDDWEWIVGSRRFAASLAINPVSVVVVDMVGDANQEIFLDRNSDPALSEKIWLIAKTLGYDQQIRMMLKYGMLDDHTPFRERGWPAIDIIDFDYPHWHTTQDTADKVSALSLERVGRVLQTWLDAP